MTLRQRLHRRLCMAWWTLKHGKLEAHFSVPAGGLHPQHLVIVLPPEFREFDVAHRILEKLLRRLSPRTCTVLVRDGFRTWLSSDLGVRVVAFDPSAHNWLGFPKPQLVRRVKDIGADAVIDLTPGFNPFTAALAALLQPLCHRQDEDAGTVHIREVSDVHVLYNVLRRTGLPLLCGGTVYCQHTHAAEVQPDRDFPVWVAHRTVRQANGTLSAKQTLTDILRESA